MTVVPAEIWIRIAHYVTPNPIEYVNCSLICKNAKETFMSDSLWRAFTPVHETTHLSHKFAERLKGLSAGKAKSVRLTWEALNKDNHKYTDGEKVDWDNDPLDLILPQSVLFPHLQYSPRGVQLLRKNRDFALALALTSQSLGLSCSIPYGSNEDFLRAVFRAAKHVSDFTPLGISEDLLMWYLCLSGSTGRMSSYDFVTDNVLLDYNAYRAHPYLLVRAPDHIKSDREFVLELMKQAPSVLQYASVDLQKDVNIALASQRGDTSGWSLRGVHRDLLSNKEFALRYFTEQTHVYGRVLEDFSTELRNDKDVVSVAVNGNPDALKYASDALRDDRELVLCAIENHGKAFQFASKRLRSDPGLTFKALETCNFAFSWSECRDDKEVALKAMSIEPQSLLFASTRLRSDREIVMAAVQKSGRALYNASYELKNDREVAMQAIMNDAVAFRFLSEELRADKLLIKAATEKQPDLIAFAL